MKITPWVGCAGILASILFANPSRATNVGTMTVEQPVNLAEKSDPARIPLGAVGVVCNYASGILPVISEPRACPDGAMPWKGGVELNQNLASVFGISVEDADLGASEKPPVVIRLKSWKPPAYSPHTKEQVLAATLWCVLHTAGGTPKRPLEIQVIAEGEADKALEAKFSRNYVTRADEGEPPVPPPQVPGTVLETDGRGIRWVVFPEVKKPAPSPPSLPSMILFNQEGADESPGTFYILPLWGNGQTEDQSLRLNQWSAPMCYSRFKPDGIRDANATLDSGRCQYVDATRAENGDGITLGHPRMPEPMLAANIHALILAAQPTVQRPLTVSIVVEEGRLAAYPAFRTAPGWKETRHGTNNILLESEFVWDPVARKLIKGSVPLVNLDVEYRLTTLAER